MLPQCLEPVPVLLDDGDRHVTGLARVDVANDSGLALVGAGDDRARGAVANVGCHAVR